MTDLVLNYLKVTEDKIEENLTTGFNLPVIWRNNWCKHTNIKNSKMLEPAQEQSSYWCSIGTPVMKALFINPHNRMGDRNYRELFSLPQFIWADQLPLLLNHLVKI